MKNNIYFLILSAAVVLTVSGCGTLDRSFVGEMSRDSDSFFQAGKDFPVVGGDSGQAFRSREEIQKRTPASARAQKLAKEDQSLKDELNQKEINLSEAEMAEFQKDSKFLQTESDKLYYLSLSGSERENYIQTKKDEYRDDHGLAKDMAKTHSIHSAEISVGMSKAEVMKMWGRPSKVQIAGNPRFQNEMWMFNEDGTIRQVYFEQGFVNGWALDL